MARNKLRVVPGIIGKTVSGVGRFAPRGVISPLAGAFYKKLGEGS